MAFIAFCDYLRPLAIPSGIILSSTVIRGVRRCRYCISMDERRIFSRTMAETLHFLAYALDWLFSWRRMRKMAIESNKAKRPESFFICQLNFYALMSEAFVEPLPAVPGSRQKHTCPARRRSYLVVLWIFFCGGIGLGRTERSMDVRSCRLLEVWRDVNNNSGQQYVVSFYVGDQLLFGFDGVKI